jgi:glycosyltransferase involved in cell wall biosynthesis
MKYMIFVPAYYAEKTLADVIERIPSSTYADASEILIQDDASTDNTFSIAKGLTSTFQKLTVIRNDVNLGYGGTQKKAYSYAINKGYDAVAMIHGDGQLPPECLPQMLAPLLYGQADIVLGSRILGDPLQGGMPLYKYLGNRFLTCLTNRVFHQDLTDYHTGYTVYSATALRKIDYMSCGNGHEISTEVLIRAAKSGLRIIEVAVPTWYGAGSRSVTLQTSIKYGLTVIMMLCREIMKGGIRNTSRAN